MMYLHRILRLVPMVALAILLYSTIYSRMTDGPLWTVLSSFFDMCQHTWWYTLLFIQNYEYYENMVKLKLIQNAGIFKYLLNFIAVCGSYVVFSRGYAFVYFIANFLVYFMEMAIQRSSGFGHFGNANVGLYF